jgi:transposase-like protein
MRSRLIEYPYPEQTRAVGYRSRKSYDTAFNVKVAVEAAKEQETLQELSARFAVSPGQISQWKQQLLEGEVGPLSARCRRA